MAHLHSYVIRDERCKRCGRCLSACPQGAINVPQGHAITGSYGTAFIDQSLCDGCGACVDACKLRAIGKVFKPRFK
ncbi:4Fe-4S binding protein [Adlercreutzia equolifaciens]|uniref:4Fe-4S binding protein n=1 Tax=Adlercreutzia equolifaciens TaxID=446660 RepID=UPI0023AFDFD0|nr:4Fe-4S binding protein [Adlercreutzia equolifaciens]MDE8703279.1 4Fe-4S binding protein [Adlercreutzia equolifaciens]